MHTVSEPSAHRLRSAQIGMTASLSHRSGTDQYYLDLLRHLPAVGVDVRGMVIGEPGRLEGGMPGVESFAVEGASRLHRWRRSREVFRRIVRDAELVVSHGQPHAFPVLDLLGGRPLVVQFHGPWALEARAEGAGLPTVAIRMLQERSVYRRAARFITLSQAFARILVRRYGVPEERVRIVPGGVDASFDRSLPRGEARDRLGLPRDRPIVASTRRLEASKGIGDLLEAMHDVARAVPDALCVMTGTGRLHAELQRRAAASGLERSVRFLGHVDAAELRAVYRAADLTVVPSIAWEGFGLSVVESLASGTPVIVTDVGGLPEVVGDLDPGTIVPKADPPALARRIARALRGEVPSEEACSAYAQRFSWPVIAGRIAAVYREVSP